MDTKKIEEAVKMIIEAVGEDENREGLLETPTRIAKMYQEIFSGLGQTAEETCQNHLKSLITIWWLRRIFSSIPCVSITSCRFMARYILPMFQMAVWLGFQN